MGAGVELRAEGDRVAGTRREFLALVGVDGDDETSKACPALVRSLVYRL